MKNRMRETCSSGSVRGGGGNVPTYSALDAAQGIETPGEGIRFDQRRQGAGEAQIANCERGP